ncbi:hypothetical protein [Xanthomonas phage f20-Xaj]|uniref:Uncharacterized protein n=2 Tax=Pradovirus TaxID=1985733 RepID=A0A127AYC0_9CAUD|nr:hypothetical protein FDI07_gp36 [Xanthomonas phage f20-Xaj]YP_009276311.1 hypothetical protein FDI08_gp10 [Xanthomonas phage f30-Xaj]AMM44662.1 hypothetical protein [Xanthomonas phage f20-Xaj]AMM44701.1 hypothetical protein [Xanthomonas phage f30-Xaj]
MGEVFGGGSAKRAALKQVAAIDKQTNLQTQSTNYQIQAMADQMAQAAAQQAASEYAEKLLSAPVDTVDVRLGTSDLDLQTADLIGRRKTARSAYTRPVTTTAASRLTTVAGSDLL